MEGPQLDWLVIILAAIINMVIGFVWYSKWLFGPFWLKSLKTEPKHRPESLVYTFLTSFLIAYFLAFFQAYLGVNHATDGMWVGFYFWLGFVFTTQVSAVIWEKQPVRIFLIHTGQRLLSFLVMGGLIGS